MLIRHLAIENDRSFLDRREISFEGNISILIDPNGGGRTNLIDTLVGMLRRYILNAPYTVASPTPDEPNRWEIRYNDALNQLIVEKHGVGRTLSQAVEIDLEIGNQDLESMRAIKDNLPRLRSTTNKKYDPDPWQGIDE